MNKISSQFIHIPQQSILYQIFSELLDENVFCINNRIRSENEWLYKMH